MHSLVPRSAKWPLPVPRRPTGRNARRTHRERVAGTRSGIRENSDVTSSDVSQLQRLRSVYALVQLALVMLVVTTCTHPAFAADELPRVLVLGDSIYQQPARDAANELKGRVEVVFANMQPGEVRNTETILENLEVLLGKGPWDLIHFNCGLGDLVHRAPNMKAFRVMAREVGGVRATCPEQYEKNLHELVTRLQGTGARLVWATTTPIRHSTSNVFEMGSEVKYNAIAARVMAAHKVPINDMHTYVRDLIDMKRPASHGADPFYFDRKPLHPPILRSILNELKLARRESCL